jgi:hypothetical protein
VLTISPAYTNRATESACAKGQEPQAANCKSAVILSEAKDLSRQRIGERSVAPSN